VQNIKKTCKAGNYSLTKMKNIMKEAKKFAKDFQ